MAVISIVGTSGVGKSFLTKQLASLHCMPAFFEGEEGTIPQTVLAAAFSDENPIGRFRFFCERYQQTLERAQVISNTGQNVYVDSGMLAVDAIMRYEKPKYHDELRALIARLRTYDADFSVLLTAEESYIRTAISSRGRQTEAHDGALQRATKIQEHFLTAASGRTDVLLIDRTTLRFDDENDLSVVDARIAKVLQ